jgi:ubiquinone/menaquinone biosynthesis C-methylase UbiE
MTSNINQNYSRYFFGTKSFINSIIKKKRIEINRIIEEEIDYEKSKNLLDVGTTSSLEKHENQIIKYFYNKIDISCLSNLSLEELKSIYSKISVHKGDGRKMSFVTNNFDIVTSSATIEHVGNFNNQLKFISECLRVSKHKLFITTPNRYFPIEMHTKIPLIHFFPKKIHRKILNLIGEKYLSLEENLNLLSKNDLFRICKILSIKNFEIKEIKLFGFVSNYILIAEKN